MEKWKLPSQSQDPLFQRTYLRPLYVQMRCPGCNKLYKIDTRDLKSQTPHFDCVSCKTMFTIEPDTRHSRKLITRTLGRVGNHTSRGVDFVESQPMNEKAEGLRSCPKCGGFSPRLSEECHKCGVIFAKIENLPLDSKLGALPSLMRAWQELMNDYSNVTKHMAFVDRCDDLQAVPFALKKYQDLKDAQPHDEIAQQMFQHTLFKNFAKPVEVVSGQWAKVQKWTDKVNWGRVVRLSPLFLALVLVTVGMSHGGLRNLIGIGTSIIFICLGMALFLKGRIHWQDFWK
ncbi:MAG: hypothetical protein KF681_02990 [Bdellovibrionaceae bacterium]|nr:hypothetical protein [Pseudobdellovibrionaceae bacterium]